MPKMVHPVTGGSFDCPERQVPTWRRSGWLLESEVAPPKSRKSEDAPTAGDDNTEE